MAKETKKLTLNNFLLAIIAILLISGIWLNHHFSEIAGVLRLVTWVGLAGVIIIIASQTNEGKRLWAFSKEARIELRKVVWPTRQETVQTTMLVAAMVVAMALIMWGLDAILIWVIGWITGSRG